MELVPLQCSGPKTMALFMFQLHPVFDRNACSAGFWISLLSLTAKHAAADEHSIFGMCMVLHLMRHSPLVSEQLIPQLAVTVEIFFKNLSQFLHAKFGGGRTLLSVGGSSRSSSVIGACQRVLVLPSGSLVIRIDLGAMCVVFILGVPPLQSQEILHQ